MIALALFLILCAAGATVLGVHFLRGPKRDGFTTAGALLILAAGANMLWPAIAILVLS